MAPEERKEQLLDCAAAYILERGLSDFSLEKVAARAGVSIPLVYKYFPKCADLMCAVLEREYRLLGARKLPPMPGDTPLEPIIRRSMRHGFEYLYERGPIIRILSADRAVADLVRNRARTERSVVNEQFIERLVRDYDVPEPVAMVCSILVLNAPIHSGRALKKVGVSAQDAADIWTDFVLGGWAAVQARHGHQAKAEQARTAAAAAATPAAAAATPAAKARRDVKPAPASKAAAGARRAGVPARADGATRQRAGRG